MASLCARVGLMEQQWSVGGQTVRVSAAGRIMKAAEERGNIHVWGRVPVETGRKLEAKKMTLRNCDL